MKSDPLIISKINKNNLIIFAKDGNDQVTGYKVNLADIVTNDDVKKEGIRQKAGQLRRFSRVCSNFEKAIDSIEQINILLKNHGHHFGFDLIPHAMFCHVVILYGACFVKGEDGYPLRELYSEVLNNEIHKEVMDIRNKRFGHIDENHDVREDNLLWQVRVSDGILKPETSSMRGSYLALPSESFMHLFKDWIHELKGKVHLLESNLKSEINDLVGDIQIIE